MPLVHHAKVNRAVNHFGSLPEEEEGLGSMYVAVVVVEEAVGLRGPGGREGATAGPLPRPGWGIEARPMPAIPGCVGRPRPSKLEWVKAFGAEG